ncbi:MAG: 7TM diverse intracellular signaling domain-containing protein, partial [Spirochaetota bacterium]
MLFIVLKGAIIMGKTIKYGIIILILTIMCIILYSFSFNRVNAETNTTTNDYEHKKLLIIDNKEYTYKLGPYIEYIEDKNNERSIEDISSGKLEKEFKRSKTEKLRFGYTSSTYWLRFKIKNRIKDFNNWIIKIAYNMLDRVELFIPTESGTYIKKVAGDTIPLRKKELKHKDIAFPISLENNTEKTYYMKIQTTGSMSISPSIMSDKVFFYNDNNIQLFYGFIFGGFVTLILFNIFIFSSTGDRSYLHYILFISFLLLFYLIDTGYGYKLFWSDLPWFNTLYPVAGNLTGVFLILFSIKFLQTSKYTPIFNNLLMVVFVSGTLSAIISLFISYRIAVIIFLVNQIIAIFLLPLTSIRSWIRGNKIARFYVIAWIIFFVGILISNSIQLLNLISKDYFLLDNIYIIASHISLILFSFALADKINLMRKKTEETSRRLNNLNIYLEKKVEERTSEYEEKNKELESFSSIVAHDLRNPLSVIISAVNLINKKYIDKVPDKVKHILDMLSERTERIVKMINAIQRYSSINKEKLVLQICDINEII